MALPLNRRKFLKAGALAGIAGVWSPDSKACAPDVWASDIGKSKWDLDTPALCVDLDRMERNFKVVHEALQGTHIGIRPHVKTHKCPQIAKMQVNAGAMGVCVAKLSEGEVMLANGISEVLMTGVNISVPKIERAMSLRKKYKGFIQAVDNPRNARDLQDAAKAAGIVADVVVDIDVIKRSGVPAGEQALREAAQAARRLGWPLTKFNRKLDNVCDKLDQLGVSGMRGGGGKLASNRRTKLVEYAVSSRIVTREDLPLIDAEAARNAAD